MKIGKMNAEIKQTNQIRQHYYYVHGLGKFENMKDLRTTLKVSRQAIRMLMRVGLIQKFYR